VVPQTKVFLINKFLSGILPVFPVLLIFFALAGCGNDEGTPVLLVHPRTGPALSTRDAEITLSESGKIQAKLYSPLLDQFVSPSAYLEFPKGFRVEMFDSIHRVETTITASYGKRLEEIRVMEARGNVIVRNELKKQQLNTEILTWDERKRLIYTNAPVKITTHDKILYGDGLEANETFSRYRILNVHGQMLVKKDSI
jgi:LPS export ABC transporter protein LptC